MDIVAPIADLPKGREEQARGTRFYHRIVGERQGNRRWYIGDVHIAKACHDFLLRDKLSLAQADIIVRVGKVFRSGNHTLLEEIGRVIFLFDNLGTYLILVLSGISVADDRLFRHIVKANRIGFYHLISLLEYRGLY